MKITIRPDLDCIELIRSEFKDYTIHFLETLGLKEDDSKNWESIHTIEINENDSELVDVFDMKCYLPGELFTKPEWVFKFSKEELFNSFIISGIAVCCGLLSTDGLKTLPENLLNLSCGGYYQTETLNQYFLELQNLQNLKSISFYNCTILKDISLLEKLVNLKTLSLSRCKSLTNISSLAELVNLQSLDFSNCNSLTDIKSLSNLENLQSLNLNSCSLLTDLSSLGGLVNLQSLNLSGSKSLTDISILSGLVNLQSLDFSNCKSLKDIKSLSKLVNLQSLIFNGCELLGHISALSGLVNLKELDLSGCKLSTDLNFLSELVNLKSLNLGVFKKLTDIRALSELVNLQALDLSCCESLTDISVVSCLLNLQSLNLNLCESLTDISVVSCLLNLQTLNLSHCDSLTDISILSGLTNLQSLNLKYHRSLTDISLLSCLINLQTLDLSSCESLTDIKSLSGLKNLQTLDLSGCESLTDISVVSGLLNLQTLNLSGCKLLADISMLYGLINLQTLDLSYCELLKDISVLSGLVNLQSLNLENCRLLKDINGLTRCTNLQFLNLDRCESLLNLNGLLGLKNLLILKLGFSKVKFDASSFFSTSGIVSENWDSEIFSQFEIIKSINSLSSLENLCILSLEGYEKLEDIGSLSELVNLQSLNLNGCKSLSSISSLSRLMNLETLDLEGCKRIHDYSSLKNCLALKLLKENNMHPAESAELLCFLAVKRKDISFISEKFNSWLQELKLGFRQKHSSTNDLACSLAKGGVLANLEEAGFSFHQTLLNHPNVGISPWKIWFSENLESFGWDKIQKLAELNKPSELTFGAIGGISSCLPPLEGDPLQIAWAKKWISEIHSLYNNNPNFLKPAAAEWCLALKRLGEDELLREWIEKFTDPSDPSALDHIYKVFSAYALDLNDSESALEYALKINDPKLRDESILNLAQQFIKEGETSKAGEFLFLLTQVESRTQLAYSLAEDAAYLKIDGNAHRLLAACGDSPQSLANILDKLRLANPASEILKIMHEKLSDESRFSLSDEAIALEAVVVISKLSKVTDSTFLNEAKKAMETLLKNKPNYVK